MKAIIIGEGTKDTLNAWGVSEELTWSNSFSKITGNILVIDDQLPQGYMVRTTEQFYHEYMWVKYAGWDDWAPIRRIGTDVMNVEPETYSEKAKERHAALSAAIDELPEYMVENRKILTEMLSELLD